MHQAKHSVQKPLGLTEVALGEGQVAQIELSIGNSLRVSLLSGPLGALGIERLGTGEVTTLTIEPP